MNSTGEKTGYRVALLLVVGLTAFSSAMKELNQFQQLTLDASRLMAQWSAKIAPAEVPQAAEMPQPVIAKLETCESKQSLPTVELPWLDHSVPKPGAVVPRPSQVVDFVAAAPRTGKVQVPRIKKVPAVDLDPVAFEFVVPTDHDGEADDDAVAPELPTALKAKALKHGSFRFNVRDREMLLKTLNRNFNLRIAG
jgi:hypothetical protein